MSAYISVDLQRRIRNRFTNLQCMKKDDLEDNLRSEYDLKNLKVRRMGSGRKNFAGTVKLEPDVAEVFPNADAVNEALRFLIRSTQLATKESKG